MPTSETSITVESQSFDDQFDQWLAEMEQQIEAIRQSEQLTAEDYGTIINAR